MKQENRFPFEKMMESKQNGIDTRIQLENPIQSLFSIYSNPRNPSRLTLTGIIAFYSILNIDVERDMIVLYISYKMESPCMYIYTTENISRLYTNYGIRTFSDLQRILPVWRNELKEADCFKRVYKYVFMYTVRSQSNAIRKQLSLSNAIQLWNILFSDQYQLFLPLISFLKEYKHHEDGIRQDEWNMILIFLQLHGNDTCIQEHFDPNYAWPLLICDFVKQYVKKSTVC